MAKSKKTKNTTESAPPVEMSENIKKLIALDNKMNSFEFVFDDDNGNLFYNNEELKIKLETIDDIVHIVFNDMKYPIEIIEKNQNRYAILINGVSYAFSIETPISFERRKFLEKNKQVSKMESLKAPMPGKIIEVLIEEGADVKEGDSMIILEAMKMQNEIMSHVAGNVKKVFVRAGDIVMKDDVLLEIMK